MKLYVCYGTWTVGRPLHLHPCGEAHEALRKAGYTPEVVHSYGFGALPGVVNELYRGRREVKQLTGSYWVPALVTDDSHVVHGSREIIAWAEANHASGEAETAAASTSAPR